jgi:hypothetical protein
VGDDRTKQFCESLMLSLVEVALAAKKDDAMAEQSIANRIYRLGR